MLWIFESDRFTCVIRIINNSELGLLVGPAELIRLHVVPLILGEESREIVEEDPDVHYITYLGLLQLIEERYRLINDIALPPKTKKPKRDRKRKQDVVQVQVDEKRQKVSPVPDPSEAPSQVSHEGKRPIVPTRDQNIPWNTPKMAEVKAKIESASASRRSVSSGYVTPAESRRIDEGFAGNLKEQDEYIGMIRTRLFVEAFEQLYATK